MTAVTEKDERGLPYVPQIKEAYKNIVEGDKSSIQKKIKLGEVLNACKEDRKKNVGHRDWEAFRKIYFPEISKRTANVYMQLAKPANQEKLKSYEQHAALLDRVGEMSVRTALKAIGVVDEEDEEKDETVDDEKDETKDKPAKQTKKQLKALQQKRKDVLKDLDVDQVFQLLIATFDLDYLETVKERLSKYLEKDDLSIQPSLLRPTPLPTTA